MVSYRILCTLWSFYRTAQQTAAHGEGHNNKEKRKRAEQTNYLAWDTALAELQTKYNSYGTIQLNKNNAQIIQTGKRKGDTALFDAHTGKITEITIYDTNEQPISSKMKGIIYSFHTGQWGGIITRILYFLSAFVGGILPLTGYYLWIKRISRKKHREV